MSFSAPLPGARVTFSCVAKRKSPKRRPPRCCAFRPSMDEKSVRASRACRRAFHGATASGRNPLRPPFGPDRPALTAAQGPQFRFDSGHHGLVRSEIKQFASPSCAHRMCVKWGPSNTAGRRRISPKDGAQEVRQFAAGTGMCLRRTPAPARASWAHGCAQDVFAGWPFSWSPAPLGGRGTRQGCRAATR